METVQHGGEIIAIVIRAEFRKDGIEFFTPDSFSQQLAYMNRPKGYKIQPHTHNKVSRNVSYTLETLFIRKGLLKVDFFTANGDYIESRTLKTGDVILLATGGHGFEMLEPTEMIEVKQGPYVGSDDKVRFGKKSGE